MHRMMKTDNYIPKKLPYGEIQYGYDIELIEDFLKYRITTYISYPRLICINSDDNQRITIMSYRYRLLSIGKLLEYRNGFDSSGSNYTYSIVAVFSR